MIKRFSFPINIFHNDSEKLIHIKCVKTILNVLMLNQNYPG